LLYLGRAAGGCPGRKNIKEFHMIRTIAAALAAFALLSFGALADEPKPADTAAGMKADTKADKKASKKHKKGHKKAAEKKDAAAPTK
jgi:basic membrane lipoprotein Med (substrate-binding protein (PBP1-ABC) superfamily)